MGYTIPKPKKATLISPYEADADYTPTPLMRFQIEQVNGRPGLGSYANPLLYMNRIVAQAFLRDARRILDDFEKTYDKLAVRFADEMKKGAQK